MASQRFRSALVLAATLAAPALARGQEAAETFDQLRFILAPGSDIRVVGTDGTSVKGTFEGISGHSLAITTHGAHLRLDEDTVRRVEQRRDDSLANGARNGFYVGAGFGFLGGAAVAMEGGGPAFIPIVTAMYGGIGAGIGVAIDAMIRTPHTVYEARARGASLGVAPLVGRARKGVALAVTF